MKIFNIIGWIVVLALGFLAPMVDTGWMYCIVFAGMCIMYCISESTIYDDIDEEIIEVINKD